MINFEFEVDVWGFTVLFYSDAAEASERACAELHEISTFTLDDKSEVLIVIHGCDSKKISDENLKYIVHESNHAAMRILERVGVKLDFDNQEALCYT